MNLPYLNIGCGDIFNPHWTNIDLISNSENVKTCNIKKGLPFKNESFEVVYHSHILEHLKQDEVKDFLSEVRRVLKPNGIHRVVVPDLEQLTRVYLATLDQQDKIKHCWMVIELFDQMTRTKSGGLMADFIKNSNSHQRDFLKGRIGFEAEKLWSEKTEQYPFCFKSIFSKIVKRLQRVIAEGLVYLIGGSSFKAALREGLFRQSGEIHLWAYDKLSLEYLLSSAGFSGFTIKSAFESDIPNYNRFELDSFQTQVRKPDSIFVECRNKK